MFKMPQANQLDNVNMAANLEMHSLPSYMCLVPGTVKQALVLGWQGRKEPWHKMGTFRRRGLDEDLKS